MCSSMFLSTANTSLGRSVYLPLRLSAQILLGLVVEADSPPICFLLRLKRSASAHYCFVLKGVSQHLEYMLLLASQSCLIWTIDWGFHSVLEGPFRFWISPAFSEGVPKWSGNIPNRSCVSWILCPIWYIWGYLLLSPGLRLSYRSSGSDSFWWILLVPQFPMMKGDLKFLEGLLCSVSRSLIPDFFPPRIITKKVSTGFRYSIMFPILLGFLWSSWKDCSATASNVPVSPHLSLCFTGLMTDKVSMGCLLYLWWDFWFSRLY